jgi:hypothetical protein
MEHGQAFTLPLTYNTLPDFDNRVDAADLGRSIRGIGRLSNLVVHTLYTGEVPERRTIIRVRFYVGPPASGSIKYDLAAILGAVQLPIWWDTFCSVAKPLFEYLLAAVVSARLGRDLEKDKMLEIIKAQIERDDAYKTLVQLGHMQDKAFLQNLVGELVERSDRSMRDAVAPVGKSSGPIDIGDTELDSMKIDEAAADVLRTKEALVVGDRQTFRVRFSAVDKSGKRCKVEIVGQEGTVIPGRITDPSLMVAGNIYTRSLDTDAVAEVQAKPVLRDGAIRTLYISDGRRL